MNAVNLYEMMLIENSALSESEEKKLDKKIEDFLKDKGKIVKKSLFGKRELAYPIKKETKGNYWIYNLELDPGAVSQFSQKLKMEESVLRFLLLKSQTVLEKAKGKTVKKVKKD
ncbi:30S ribosomal protein S6 [Candidatus Gottesmanbacteria bacterium RIFCSPLOWO2_02_FULL_42_29]|uniref:Small ribosomal subunit protein bS6 n=2 Tax=Candidatus Gottesmaniibacteriota TaxID=1752720 RepID=A0A1F6BH46_9BACT|nr:MAG: 30S ribosomal protein S6 [Candidatus Gottesmanbacteria bacterium GW2011_GWA2_42_18]OGG09046.1 MAG: 30S ribosomal protein S6 [Candidatus Gottesmanbacteria bacterium RIFCSPHIGHO2_01_FULL_42_27]OGG20780.1 MAG: 30S ribosomal protein S6 [Candidatus Gottesmanbacteria bacterium RIFCSPHIGHO2_12_FULL_43_26]OGG36230.1 MAG: 30S ribosomal protein S6 [Candidatus Gottesmanbacteria bacterium RIFCSPLOWO2_01_FULL_42_22]OGG36387.1 MAG: 30S ribosomal protein S6 [Candidatus Gottesmanbacteria bacterium RIFC